MLIEEYSKMEDMGDELWTTGYCTYLCKKTDEDVSRVDSES